jgi:ankyrin repeat protein
MSDERVVRLVQAFDSSLEEGVAVLATDPAAVHLKTSLGETALHLACFDSPIAAVQELIRRGAEVDTLSDCGSTPLSDAASIGRVELVRLLLDSGASLWLDGQLEPTLHQTVRGGHVDAVRLILEAGANVNQQADFADTPLHLAAEDDCLEIAHLLLEHGADPNLQNSYDGTALDVALRHSSERCIALLSIKH